MITRKMSEDLVRQIEQLTAQLEEQRQQIASLAQDREDASETEPSAVTMPPNRNITSSFNKSRIPDAIKMITPYSGDPKTLSNWISSVESKLKFSKQLCPTTADENEVLPLWYSIIRDKIVDKANEALVQNHTPVEWDAMKKTLEDYFGDKRDMGTLLTKIPYLKQGSKSLEEFYNECRELLSDISVKVTLDQEMRKCAKTLTSSYECMISNAYIDGLNEPYSTLVRVSRPANLNDAHQSAVEQFNAAQRKKDRYGKSDYLPQKQFADVLKTKSFAPNAPTRQQRPSYSRGYYPTAPHIQPSNQNFRPFGPPAYRLGQNYQQTRTSNYPNQQSFKPQFQNSNSTPAIKHEPLSQQTRNYNRPIHNINAHETNEQSHCSNQSSPYHEITYSDGYEHEEYPDENYVETDPTPQGEENEHDETADNLNFHIAQIYPQEE